MSCHQSGETRLTCQAVEAFYSDSQAQASASSKGDKVKEKKLGEVWEKFKGMFSYLYTLIVLSWRFGADGTDPSNPKLITIEGTMQYCEELGIDPESVCPNSLSRNPPVPLD